MGDEKEFADVKEKLQALLASKTELEKAIADLREKAPGSAALQPRIQKLETRLTDLENLIIKYESVAREAVGRMKASPFFKMLQPFIQFPDDLPAAKKADGDK